MLQWPRAQEAGAVSGEYGGARMLGYSACA